MLRNLLAGATALLVAGCTVVGIRTGTEEPAYTVVGQLDAMTEVRRYGERLAAETTVPGGPDARDAAFRRLASYIFGGNREAERIAMTVPVATGSAIAMTAPVAVAGSGSGSDLTMRFFLPAGMERATAPLPTDPLVRLVAVPAETLAVRRFSGGWSDGDVARERLLLTSAVERSPWQPIGAPVAFFYDPPWTVPAFRRNEVAVAVAAGD